jgi:predicted MPP superfamily phosphohydrolase
MLSRRAFLLGTGVGLPLAAGGYSTMIEPRLHPRVVSYNVSPPDWRTDRVLRIGVVSDVHACDPWMPGKRVEAIVAAANALEPDLFVLLGDFVKGLRDRWASHVPHDHWAGPLGDLTAPLGVYAVLGNHDWWVDAAGTRAAIAGRQIPVLENEAGFVDLGNGDGLWLGGLGDQLAFKGTGRGVDDLAGLTRSIPDDGQPAILLAHEPDIFPVVPRRFSLTLSGHTHGGQVRLPFLGRYPASREHGQRYNYGHVVENDRHLVVSAGLGCSGLPIRFGVPPEINLVTVGTPAALARHHADDRAEPA